ncbi:tetratricopeptide repeat protein [Prochlorococcus marinus]|uniref:tetratricopeptide repeat protein n=1 Tax=Prochlorococcus marinus TaxID=1219 RepID=UPI0022B48EDF|nr:tetratricopeptide repeat protein [Prochlorococcus marinus]
MERPEKQEPGKRKVSEIKTFSVPFTLEKIKENITITTNTASKHSKEQIINQAFNFHSQGNIKEAVKYYQYLINQDFKDERVFSNYGVILQNLGKLHDAELYARKAIDLKPHIAENHSNLGNILRDLGKLHDAELSQRKAIDLQPNFAMAHYNLGNILRDLGKLHDAELSQRKAIDLQPNFAEAHLTLGTVLKDLGKLHDAELYARKAIDLKPDYAIAHSNLGNILKDLGKLHDAELSQRIAIDLKPDYAIAHSNLGNILKDLGKLHDAELSQRKAIDLQPNFAEAHLNLGTVLKDLGKLHDAELSTRKAIELNPDLAEAYSNLSYLELLHGNYHSGLENYEFRFKKKRPARIHGKPKIKRKDNKEFQKGEKLLVISEQGLGDTLQYMRYIPYLRKKGLDVSFSAQTKLHSLIQSSAIDQNPLTPEQVEKVSARQWIPLLSLARYLKISPKNPIISQPYIFSTDQFTQKWKNIFSKEKRPIIGINWQGDREAEKRYQGRSIPLETFSLLFKQNELSILSLQKGFGSEQLEQCSFKNKFVECQPQINSTWDFLENAAIIQNCDLIITCDTSIAHLAGGMGKKVWLLLRDIPFWTWGLKEETTFWYPSMRLFRQHERHNWQEVMERVSIALKKEIATN